MSVHLIKEVIEKFAPHENAEKWDNTGVLIDSLSYNDSKKILLTIDFTDDVLNECISKSVKTVVSYHPVIFRPLTNIITSRYVLCIQNGISIYSPHTQLDFLMNEYLKNILGKEVSLFMAVKILKKECSLDVIRVVKFDDKNKIYNKDEIIVGVGSAFKSPDYKDSLIITGEMSHHDMLRCRENNCEVILLEHSNSERIFLKELKKKIELDSNIAGYEIIISENDRDPVTFL